MGKGGTQTKRKQDPLMHAQFAQWKKNDSAHGLLHSGSGLQSTVRGKVGQQDAKQKTNTKRKTKKEIEAAAIMNFIDSAEFEDLVQKRIASKVRHVLKKRRIDEMYDKANQLLHEWTDLGDGEEEQELLVNYVSKFNNLQLKKTMQDRSKFGTH